MSNPRIRIQPGDGDSRHGTANGYNNLRCRCDECRAAWAAQVLARKTARTPPPPDDPRHGRATTYANRNCRCRPCMDASATDRRHRANRKAASR